MEEHYIETTIDNFKFKEMRYQPKSRRKLLAEGSYKKYRFYIYSLGTHPTAYIEIPKSNPIHGKSINECDIEVHGGITYAESILVDKKTVIL